NVAANTNYNDIYPKLCISINIKNEHVLPYFMGLIEDLRYPKDRINLNFFSGNEESLIKRWIKEFPQGLYRSIIATEEGGNWREKSLNFGRRKACNLLLIMDTNNFLLRDSLRQMISFIELPVVLTPFIYSPLAENVNNAKDLMLDDWFVQREKLDFIRVYYSNGPLLINLKHPDSSYLTFEEDNLTGYEGLGNPIDVFATSAFKMNISILFSNHFNYGYFLNPSNSNSEHAALYSTFLASWISDSGYIPFPTSSVLPQWYPYETKFGFDQIYLINLARRTERLNKMKQVLRLVGMKYKRFEAVDGQNLTKRQLSSLKFLPGYLDPFHKRPMKLGEIGCFLSHYSVWKDVVVNGYDRAIVLEDDLKFTQNGTLIINQIVQDLMKTRLDWDFIYFGRKKMSQSSSEYFVPGHLHLSTVSYSYWTIGYAISLSGAKKLIKADPLNNLLALDEFLPIMYEKHPNTVWKEFFEEKEKLRAFAVYPVILEPERYTNQPNYLSDTEGSSQVDFNYLINYGDENVEEKNNFLENEFFEDFKLKDEF
uniref:Glycosyltransferase 25 family member n=1 Tax=Meloidogyne hapla TaxID=6305 RepID=A0A1I8BPS8_MELHA